MQSHSFWLLNSVINNVYIVLGYEFNSLFLFIYSILRLPIIFFCRIIVVLCLLIFPPFTFSFFSYFSQNRQRINGSKFIENFIMYVCLSMLVLRGFLVFDICIQFYCFCDPTNHSFRTLYFFISTWTYHFI